MSHSLVGFQVHAADGPVGTVDPATPDAEGSFLVLAPEPHFFAKRLVIPAEAIERVDADARVVLVSWTKEHLKDAAQLEDEDVEVPTDTMPFYDHELDAYTEP
jgi:hypothetical protein